MRGAGRTARLVVLGLTLGIVAPIGCTISEASAATGASVVALATADDGPWTIGRTTATYTFTPRNTGTVATSGTITVTDALPPNLTLTATPVGIGWACTGGSGATALSCTSTSAIAAGGAGNAIAATVTVGNGTPVGPAAIANTAFIFGGGDAVHAAASSAAASPTDTTRIDSATLAVATTDGRIAPGTTATDTFRITNTSSQAGAFTVSTPTIVGPGGVPLPASGYTLGAGTTVYASLSALNAAIAALGPIAAGSAITLGVQYAVPPAASTAQSVTDTLAATITAGGITSAPASTTTTDVVTAPILGLTTTDNGPWTIGQTGAAYTIVPKNTGNVATFGTITIADTLPPGITLAATPTGEGAVCTGAAGASTFTCTGATAIPIGAVGSAITAGVNVGPATPTGTNAIVNTASVYGGGDPTHASASTAATSPGDPTTIATVALTAAASAPQTLVPGTIATDTFTLTNTGTIAGAFTVTASAIAGPAGPITPSGFTLNGAPAVYATFAALQSALAGLGPTPPGGTAAVGIRYPVPTGAAAPTVSDVLSATITGGGATSAAQTATVVDGIATRALAIIVPTGAGAVTPGATATDTFTLTNASSQPGQFIVPAQAILTGPAGALTPTAYAVAGRVLPRTGATTPLQDLQAALAALPATPINGTVVVGVSYTAPVGNIGQTVTDTLTAAVTAGGVTSPLVTATTTDTIHALPLLTILGTGAGALAAGTPATDVFTLTNTSGQPGTFQIPALPAVTGPSGSVAVVGITLGGTPVPQAGMTVALRELQAALAGLAPTASGAAILVGVTYVVPAGALSGLFTDSVTATVTAGGVVSTPVTASVGDTLAPKPTLTVVAVKAAQIVGSGTTVVDAFTLTNVAAQPGTFTVTQPTILATTGAIAPAAYTLTIAAASATYPTVDALNLALAATVAPGGAVVVGVLWPVPAGAPNGSSATTTLSAVVTIGDVTSLPASATVVDTLQADAQVLVTAPPGQSLTPGTSVTDAFTIANRSVIAGFFQVVNDAVVSAPSAVGYTLDTGSGPTAYRDLASLDAALKPVLVPPNGTVVVGVTYTPASALGAGTQVSVSLSATVTIAQLAGGSVVSPVSQANAIDIVPGTFAIAITANMAIAQPGDIVTYAVDLTNRALAPVANVRIADFLPRGFAFVPNSAAATLDGAPLALTATIDGTSLLVTGSGTVPPGSLVHLTYGSAVTPDAFRGSGTTIAIVSGTVGGRTIASAPATTTIRIGHGVLDSCGTILGRVFVDAKGDGRQTAGEPGVSHAVIVLDDGSRITADDKGLFHVPCTHIGWRTGTLDLTAIPGYAIAPNRERAGTGATVMVRLEAQGTVRMNFGVIKAGSDR